MKTAFDFFLSPCRYWICKEMFEYLSEFSFFKHFHSFPSPFSHIQTYSVSFIIIIKKEVLKNKEQKKCIRNVSRSESKSMMTHKNKNNPPHDLWLDLRNFSAAHIKIGFTSLGWKCISQLFFGLKIQFCDRKKKNEKEQKFVF